MATLQTANPYDGSPIASYETWSDAELSESLEALPDAQQTWQSVSMEHRATLFQKMAVLLRENVAEASLLMTKEMGKPITEAEAEVNKCAWVCDYFADNAEKFLEPVEKPSDGSRAYVRYDPLGTVLAIMPWNFPYWQLFRQAAPSMMAGNTMVLKHAEIVTGCALHIEQLFRAAGFPDDAFKTYLIDHDQVERVIASPSIGGVALTGSVRAGRIVAATAGKYLKPSVMELGGSDPFIVLADCDLNLAVEKAVQGRTLNSGQSCIAAKRFIVAEGIYDAFVEHFTQAMSELVMGDPMDRDTNIGPQARADLRDELHDQVLRTIDAGGRLMLGGEVPDGDGFFYPATVVADVPPTSAMGREETFGPAAAVIRANDLNDAISIANDSIFGLGASVWSTGVDADTIAPQLNAGAVFFNGIVKSDPRIPFGGIKQSGYGRELAREGILEFVNQKTVWIG